MLLEFTAPTGEPVLLDPTTIRLVEPWYSITLEEANPPDEIRPRAIITIDGRTHPLAVAETADEIRDRLTEHAQRIGLANDTATIAATVETGGLGFGGAGEQLHAVTIYGASDDLVEVEGYITEEFNVYGPMLLTLTAPDGATATIRAAFTVAGWNLSTEHIDGWIWPATIGQRPDRPEDPALFLQVPTGTTLVGRSL